MLPSFHNLSPRGAPLGSNWATAERARNIAKADDLTKANAFTYKCASVEEALNQALLNLVVALAPMSCQVKVDYERVLRLAESAARNYAAMVIEGKRLNFNPLDVELTKAGANIEAHPWSLALRLAMEELPLPLAVGEPEQDDAQRAANTLSQLFADFNELATCGWLA